MPATATILLHTKMSRKRAELLMEAPLRPSKPLDQDRGYIGTPECVGSAHCAASIPRGTGPAIDRSVCRSQGTGGIVVWAAVTNGRYTLLDPLTWTTPLMPMPPNPP